MGATIARIRMSGMTTISRRANPAHNPSSVILLVVHTATTPSGPAAKHLAILASCNKEEEEPYDRAGSFATSAGLAFCAVFRGQPLLSRAWEAQGSTNLLCA